MTARTLSTGGTRDVVMTPAFFTGYRRNAIEPDEVIAGITVPITSYLEFFKCYKQAKRREDDISIVNAAMRVKFDPESGQVVDCSLIFGGMAPTTVAATLAQSALIGR